MTDPGKVFGDDMFERPELSTEVEQHEAAMADQVADRVGADANAEEIEQHGRAADETERPSTTATLGETAISGGQGEGALDDAAQAGSSDAPDGVKVGNTASDQPRRKLIDRALDAANKKNAPGRLKQNDDASEKAEKAPPPPPAPPQPHDVQQITKPDALDPELGEPEAAAAMAQDNLPATVGTAAAKADDVPKTAARRALDAASGGVAIELEHHNVSPEWQKCAENIAKLAETLMVFVNPHETPANLVRTSALEDVDGVYEAYYQEAVRRILDELIIPPPPASRRFGKFVQGNKAHYEKVQNNRFDALRKQASEMRKLYLKFYAAPEHAEDGIGKRVDNYTSLIDKLGIQENDDYFVEYKKALGHSANEDRVFEVFFTPTGLKSLERVTDEEGQFNLANLAKIFQEVGEAHEGVSLDDVPEMRPDMLDAIYFIYGENDQVSSISDMEHTGEGWVVALSYAGMRLNRKTAIHEPVWSADVRWFSAEAIGGIIKRLRRKTREEYGLNGKSYKSPAELIKTYPDQFIPHLAFGVVKMAQELHDGHIIMSNTSGERAKKALDVGRLIAQKTVEAVNRTSEINPGDDK